MCITVSSTYMYVRHVCTDACKARRGYWIPWSYRWLGAILWVLGPEPKSSVRAVRALNPSHLSGPF